MVKWEGRALNVEIDENANTNRGEIRDKILWMQMYLAGRLCV